MTSETGKTGKNYTVDENAATFEHSQMYFFENKLNLQECKIYNFLNHYTNQEAVALNRGVTFSLSDV